MTTPGRIFLMTLFCLLIAGAAFGQDEPAESTGQTTGQIDNEVDQVPEKTQTRSPRRIPFGLRAGYTNWKNWSQAHFGGHIYLGELWPNVEFTPNIEAGLGDDVFIMTLNGDITYMFTELTSHPWGLYGGGSLSFNLVDPEVGDSTTDLGLSGLIGTRYTFSNDHRGMVEFRFGIMDSPSIKVTLGYTIF
jgi:hypothetical protein